MALVKQNDQKQTLIDNFQAMKSREAVAETTALEMQILLDEAEKENISLDTRLAEQDAVMESLEADLQMQHTQISKGAAERYPHSSVGGYLSKGSSQPDAPQQALPYRSSFM